MFLAHIFRRGMLSMIRVSSVVVAEKSKIVVKQFLGVVIPRDVLRTVRIVSQKNRKSQSKDKRLSEKRHYIDYLIGAAYFSKRADDFVHRTDRIMGSSHGLADS